MYDKILKNPSINEPNAEINSLSSQPKQHAFLKSQSSSDLSLPIKPQANKRPTTNPLPNPFDDLSQQ